MNKLLVLCGSTPDNPEVGYGDHWEYYINGVYESGGHGSCCPNPYKPSTGDPWQECYGWLDNGKYEAQVVDHHKYGKCLVLREGKACASRTPNPNHNGKHILTEIMVHSGGWHCKNPNWRGSAGCITIKPDEWVDLTDLWEVGEEILVEVSPLIENQPIASSWWKRFQRLLSNFLPRSPQIA